MSRQELENFTQNHSHHGVNCPQVLQKFLGYSALSKDPQNIFRFMQEKAICIFLPAFWVAKASYSAEIGDYSACFQCVELAFSYADEDQAQIIDSLNQKQRDFRRKLIDEMRQFPLHSKRTVAQFNFEQMLQQCKRGKSKRAQLLQIYDNKYKSLRQSKQRKAMSLRSNLPQSWLSAGYQKESQIQKMIEEKIHQNSLKAPRDVKYHSMRTPIRARDPHRLTKTMDSVQILKKKRSSREKHKKREKHYPNGDDSQAQSNVQNDSSRKMMNSLPVGGRFSKLKRRVTFKAEDSSKIQQVQFNNGQNKMSQRQFASSERDKQCENMDQQAHIRRLHISKS